MKTHSRAISLTLAAVAALACLISFAAYLANRSEKKMPVEEKKKQVYARYENDPWPKLGEPQPGDWLISFEEEGQTYEEFKKELWNRKTSKRHTIYLQPLGEFKDVDERIIGKMRDFAGIFFGCDVTLLPPIPVPEKTYNAHRRQYNASEILDILETKVPDDALSYSAITLEDLYVPELNFVFGLASLSDRVGVYSLIRYHRDSDDETLLLKRSIKVMTHEVGHIFGLNHCIFYQCGMCGSNSLRESDRRPLFFCPLCLDKLDLALDLDVVKRYEKMREFFKENGLDDEAAFVDERLEYLDKTRSRQPE